MPIPPTRLEGLQLFKLSLFTATPANEPTLFCGVDLRQPSAHSLLRFSREVLAADLALSFDLIDAHASPLFLSEGGHPVLVQAAAFMPTLNFMPTESILP
tara:strand:+ start:2028 stop:2327 length:300 start_codon:yes stop_codon:yes gene_type:complete